MTSLPSILPAGAALLLGWLAAPVHADILYVSNADSTTIEKFTSNGVGSLFASADPSTRPQGLAFDSAGNLYASYFYHVPLGGFSIEKYAPNGSHTTFVSPGFFSTNGLASPDALAFDTAGNLYV